MGMGNDKKYDLEDRTLDFSARVISYVNKLPESISNEEIGSQLVRAGCPIGANYIEANEAVSKQDFVYRIKISRKEAKETGYWLKLSQPKKAHKEEKHSLLKESEELMKIFGSILGSTDAPS